MGQGRVQKGKLCFLVGNMQHEIWAPASTHLPPFGLRGPWPQALHQLPQVLPAHQLHAVVTDAITPSRSAARAGCCQLGAASV